MSLRIKSGVSITGIKPEMVLAAIIADGVYKSEYISECWITSGLEAKHMTNSLHYVGYALDFRINNLSDYQREKILIVLKDRLGKQYDVILKSNCIHIEFQPEMGNNL